MGQRCLKNILLSLQPMVKLGYVAGSTTYNNNNNNNNIGCENNAIQRQINAQV